MARCIIHIGMHKTGSTSIQGSLHRFQDNQFLYASLGGNPNHSVAIYSLFAPQPERHHVHRAGALNGEAVSAYVAAMQTDLQAAITATGGRTLLISGEDISLLPADGLLRMRDYFRARFEALTIVGYVRPPGSAIVSRCQERVKHGAGGQFSPERAYPGYRKSLGALDDIYGRENVLLWKFDPAAFPGGCVVRDFCSRLGISLPEAKIVRLNESFSRQVIALLYTYRRFCTKQGYSVMRAPEAHNLGLLLSSVGKDRFRLSPEIVNPVLEKRREETAWTEARIGQSLAEELGEHQPGDVRDGSDLLRPDAAALKALRALLGDAAPAGITGKTPAEVARLVHAFRKEHSTEDGSPDSKPAKRGGDDNDARVRELVRLVGKENPGLLEDISGEQAAALILMVFQAMNDTLARKKKGAVSCPGLGRFLIKKARKGTSRSQIRFHPAELRNATAPRLKSEG